jgi:CHAT domain-containing protein
VFQPLPETELELRYLAQAMGTGRSQLFLAENATETRVKSEDLGAISVLAFATHAVASGEFDGSNEPGLALTPPQTGTPVDDGFLAASEIATLSLSAELVILSACNTGSPELRSGAEGLSGLARAFFHAGARSLLVSHWPVDSQATVYLTTQMAEALRRDPRLTRAEAFRQSVRGVASGTYDARFTHPFYWAPFFLVGDL